MPTTPKLGIRVPSGSDPITLGPLATALYDADAGAAGQTQVDRPFFLKSVAQSGANVLVTLGPGRLDVAGVRIAQVVDSVITLTAPLLNTTYEVFATPTGITSAVLGARPAVSTELWRVAVGASLAALTPTDRRAELIGGDAPKAAADLAAHAADPTAHAQYATQTSLSAHAAALDPHPQYATDGDLAAHAAAADPHAQYATDTDLTAHGLAPDPHPQYASDADLSAHLAAANPHPLYATDADLAPLLLAVTNVKAAPYNATGDGSTDDRAAVASALAAAAAAGGELVFPPGTYRLSARLTAAVGAGKRLRLRGIGEVTLLSDEASDGTAILDLTGTASSVIEIERITVRDNLAPAGTNNRNAIQLTTFKRARLVEVTGTKAGAWGIGLKWVTGGTLVDCHGDDNRVGGISLSACQNISAFGGSCNDNGCLAPDYGYGFCCATTVYTDHDSVNKNVLVSGMTLSGNLRHGVDVHNGWSVKVEGCHIDRVGRLAQSGGGAAAAGIYAANQGRSKDVKDFTAIGNTIDLTGANGSAPTLYGVEIGSVEDGSEAATESGTFLILGNTIRGSAHKGNNIGVFVYNPSVGYGPAPARVRIESNTFEGGGTAEWAIHFSNNATHYGMVSVRGNHIHLASTTQGAVYVVYADRTIVEGNVIDIDAGAGATGIYIQSTFQAIVSGNLLNGPTLTTTTAVVPSSVTAPQMVRRGNLLNGAALADTT